MSRRNEGVARLLENIAKLLAIQSADCFRIHAYSDAARAIGAMSEDVEELHRAGRLQEIHGVGPSIGAKLAEYLDTGRSVYLEELKAHVPVAAADLLEVPGVGAVRARALAERLGIASVPELALAAREHRLRTLPGFGPKLEEQLGGKAARVAQRTRRMLLGTALPAAEDVVRQLRRCPAVRAIQPAGSIRRMKEAIGDIDIPVSSEQPADVMPTFTGLPSCKEVLAEGPTLASILTRDDLQVDVRVIGPDAYGSALQYFTGSNEHNIGLRSLALARGWKLSEYSLCDTQGRRIAARG